MAKKEDRSNIFSLYDEYYHTHRQQQQQN